MVQKIHECVSSGGKILFVSTKKQAADSIANLAKETSQHYVNHRWLGGMLTNWKTISNSIKRYKKLSLDLKAETIGFTKKEILKMGIQRDKLERSLGGISEMTKVPDMIFIIDTNIEELAVKESIKLNIPIVAILDTNSDPAGISYPIPGNDDARRAINLYCDLIKQTIIDAQSRMTKIETTKNQINNETELKKENKKDIKNTDKLNEEKKSTKSKEKIKTVKKISKSIISKVKSLAKKKIK